MKNHFTLSNRDSDNFAKVCKFVVLVYLKAWFQAPNNDLQLLKELVKYETIDKSNSEASVKKFKNHLWYLSPELCTFAFFNDNVSNDSKMEMVKALQNEPVQHQDFQYDDYYQEDIEGTYESKKMILSVDLGIEALFE